MTDPTITCRKCHADMHADLDKERKSMTRLWSKREEQIRCVIEAPVPRQFSQAAPAATSACVHSAILL